jgi:hypothetical protein
MILIGYWVHKGVELRPPLFVTVRTGYYMYSLGTSRLDTIQIRYHTGLEASRSGGPLCHHAIHILLQLDFASYSLVLVVFAHSLRTLAVKR